MMRNLTTLLAMSFVTLGVMTTPAQAGIMLEPYLGLEQGQTYAVTSTADASYKTSGTAIGARIGYSLPALFWLGVDYSMMSGKGKPDIGGSDGDLKRTDLYAVAGVDLPILLRAWAGFGLMNSATVSTGGVDTKISGGTKMKAGVGLTMLPLVSVNLELFNHKGAKYETGGTEVSTTALEDNGGLLTVSLPLDF